MMGKDKRTVQIFKDGIWENSEIIFIKSGNKFKINESTGEELILNGSNILTAIKDAYLNENNNAVVEIDISS